jgi:hypothetical protein
MTQGVEQCGLSMVNMSHYADDRGSFAEVKLLQAGLVLFKKKSEAKLIGKVKKSVTG